MDSGMSDIVNGTLCNSWTRISVRSILVFFMVSAFAKMDTFCELGRVQGTKRVLGIFGFFVRQSGWSEVHRRRVFLQMSVDYLVFPGRPRD
jgi:hypothetical protein